MKLRIKETSSDLVHDLKFPITEVKALILDKALIPNSQYLINDNNNKVVLDSTTYTLTKGSYDVDELITLLNNETTGTWSVDKKTHKITINKNGSTVNFSQMSSNIKKILGFDGDKEDIALSPEISSDNIYNLSSSIFYKIYIDEVVSKNQSNFDNRMYTMIFNNVGKGNYQYYQRDLDDVAENHYYSNPFVLDRLTIKIKDEDDNLVDFNNVPYVLEFRVIKE
jgi:hypothetical protein